MRNYKKLEDLDVLDDFMLNAIANDPDVAEPFFQKVLSVLLEREIGEISVHAQVFVPADTPEKRGICLDVEISERDDSPAKCRIYNVEGQNYKENFLQKRCRFYQAKKDSKRLKRGERDWSKLPDLYMIVITNYDPFGEDSMIYTFENVCRKYPDIRYEDGLKFIYFNTSGTKDGTTAIKQLLTYLDCSKIECVTNENIAQIHNYVSDVKYSAEVKHRFMTVGEWFDRHQAIAEAEGREKGLAEGLAEGRAEGRTEGRMEALLDILSDMGPIPQEIYKCLEDKDEETIRRWIKVAAKAESIEAFWEAIIE